MRLLAPLIVSSLVFYTDTDDTLMNNDIRAGSPGDCGQDDTSREAFLDDLQRKAADREHVAPTADRDESLIKGLCVELRRHEAVIERALSQGLPGISELKTDTWMFRGLCLRGKDQKRFGYQSVSTEDAKSQLYFPGLTSWTGTMTSALSFTEISLTSMLKVPSSDGQSSPHCQYDASCPRYLHMPQRRQTEPLRLLSGAET